MDHADRPFRDQPCPDRTCRPSRQLQRERRRRLRSKGDLSDPGRNLLVFVHGFDNTFENAITRAAFNQQWLEQSGVAAASTAVVAFSWPSAGKLISIPFPDKAYRDDQRRAGQSGLPLMTFFSPASSR